MISIYNIIIITVLFHFSISDADYKNNWRSYPTCQIGRLQSPIEIKEYESIYANNFSFVYQSYKDSSTQKDDNENRYASMIKKINDGGYINFERGGVIKQYQFIRAELYPALHKIDGDKFKYELHLIHEKNLDFVTNKNQYRSIQDANMYLVIVLRYSECKNKEKCISDNGLLNILNTDNNINLNNFNVFQDKRAYFYEGSFLHIPCDENVNYYVVKDFFYLNNFNDNSIIILDEGDFATAEKFGRPVYKNFMNYKEVLGNNYFSFKKIVISFLFIIILL